MKYIERVLKEFEDETHFNGVRLELTEFELYILFETLKNKVEFNINDKHLYNNQKELLNKFKKLIFLKEKGYFRNIEID